MSGLYASALTLGSATALRCSVAERSSAWQTHDEAAKLGCACRARLDERKARTGPRYHEPAMSHGFQSAAISCDRALSSGLTPSGEALRPALTALGEWAHAHLGAEEG
jgi:hypothetical protein